MHSSISRIFALLFVIGAILAGARAAYAQGYKDTPGPTDPNQANPASPNTITLPDSGSTTTDGTAWAITNNGTGRVGYFYQNNPSSANPAVEVRTVSTATAATAILGQSLATSAGATSSGVRGLNWGTGSAGYGVMGQHYGSGTAVYGYVAGAGGRGVLGNSTATTGAGKGVQGITASYDGVGGSFSNSGTSGDYGGVAVFGTSNGGSSTIIHPGGSYYRAAGEFAGANGVIGAANAGSGYGVTGLGYIGVYGVGSNYGGFFSSSTATGLYAHGITNGIYATGGSAAGNAGGYFTANSFGVQGFGTCTFSNCNGLYGAATTSPGGIGVYGDANYAGLWGGDSAPQDAPTYGVVGYGKTYGVWARALGSGTVYAGYFSGNVYVSGSVKAQSYSSHTTINNIANPLDSSKYIEQAGVISSEMLGVQSGNVTLDAKGEALVTMPNWYQASFKDYRYSLTAVGASAPGIYVAQKMQNNQFKISGGKPGMEVSWLVSAVRQDQYAKNNPLQTAVDRAVLDKVDNGPTANLPATQAPPAQPAQQVAPSTGGK